MKTKSRPPTYVDLLGDLLNVTFSNGVKIAPKLRKRVVNHLERALEKMLQDILDNGGLK